MEPGTLIHITYGDETKSLYRLIISSDLRMHLYYYCSSVNHFMILITDFASDAYTCKTWEHHVIA
jgi:hypothetical protein